MFDFFTIGYFQLSAGKLGALLEKYNVNAIADVRSSPFSKSHPNFNRNSIQESLSPYGISYVFLGDSLGARPKDDSCFRDGRVDFDLLSASPFFKEGLRRLEKGRENFRIALMCAERDPITCHRSILVSRHLVERGASVGHILHNGNIESHAGTILRLIDTLKLKDHAKEHQELIERHAYELQGRRIAFHESQENKRLSPDTSPRML